MNSDSFLSYNAPSFSLPDETGAMHRLSDFAGSWLVLYFYPMDDTPGCTVEACSFRDMRDEIMKFDAEIVGISKDDSQSHGRFKEKHELNFLLLSDINHQVIESYGAWQENGSDRGNTLRKTFIINPNGFVVREYDDVTPEGHGEQIVADLKSLQTT